MDGDTVVVRPRGRHGRSHRPRAQRVPSSRSPSMVSSGHQVADLASPEAGVSHVSVQGYRAESALTPSIVPFGEFLLHSVQDGDRIEFHVDQRQPTNDGQRARRATWDPRALAVGPWDNPAHAPEQRRSRPRPRRHRTPSFLKRRRSVMRRQKQALEDSLTRLETTVLGATSQTDAESAIRVQEAELIAKVR